jgi:hypothetical protein
LYGADKNEALNSCEGNGVGGVGIFVANEKSIPSNTHARALVLDYNMASLLTGRPQFADGEALATLKIYFIGQANRLEGAAGAARVVEEGRRTGSLGAGFCAFEDGAGFRLKGFIYLNAHRGLRRGVVDEGLRDSIASLL